MPRLGQNMESHKLAGNFSFTGARIANLGATEYTLVTIVIDVTGSLMGFEDNLRKMLVMAVKACQKSARSGNLMIRVVLFSTMYPGGTLEVHGFKLLHEIDADAYPVLRTGGGTPLYDACYNSIGAMNAYAKELVDQEYLVNGITFIITDGMESYGASTTTPKMIAAEMKKSVTGEVLESHVSILIGMNLTDATGTENREVKDALEAFRQDAGISDFKDSRDLTERNAAKMAKFVDTSVSSTSQALGTGGPSQAIPATI